MSQIVSLSSFDGLIELIVYVMLMMLFITWISAVDEKVVRATLSLAQGVETRGGIQSINIGTKYRSRNTMHVISMSDETQITGQM
jgi:hypothetical protein